MTINVEIEEKPIEQHFDFRLNGSFDKIATIL